jgi:hypothetical protein
VLAVPIAQERATMHLDTVCTMVDVDKIVMYPNVADSLQAYAVTLADRADDDRDLVLSVAAAEPFLVAAAKAMEIDTLHQIDTGLDPVTAEREQWDDGNNTLAIAPRLTGPVRARWWLVAGGLLVLLVVGAVGGYAAATLRQEQPVTSGTPRPVPARSPSVPVLPTPAYAQDIAYPPLSPDLTYREHRIGVPPYRWAYDVPVGWSPQPVAFAETRWRPADEPTTGGYSLRVKIINEHRTNEEMVAEKLGAMQAGYDDVNVIEQTTDTLSFSYREPGTNRLRFNTFQWFTPVGGATAEFEMSVVGRRVDVPGLEQLLDHVAASVHQLA